MEVTEPTMKMPGMRTLRAAPVWSITVASAYHWKFAGERTAFRFGLS